MSQVWCQNITRTRFKMFVLHRFDSCLSWLNKVYFTRNRSSKVIIFGFIFFFTIYVEALRSDRLVTLTSVMAPRIGLRRLDRSSNILLFWHTQTVQFNCLLLMLNLSEFLDFALIGVNLGLFNDSRRIRFELAVPVPALQVLLLQMI